MVTRPFCSGQYGHMLLPFAFKDVEGKPPCMFSVFFIAQKSSYKCEKKLIENVEKRSNQRRQINESLKGEKGKAKGELFTYSVYA